MWAEFDCDRHEEKWQLQSTKAKRKSEVAGEIRLTLDIKSICCHLEQCQRC